MVVMRHHLSGNFISEKFKNDLIVLLVALHYWRVSGIRGGCLCEPHPFRSYGTCLNWSSRTSCMGIWENHDC